MATQTTRPPSASLSRSDVPNAPTVIGARYIIERQIGLGSMGAVYEAYDTAQGRKVAVKRLTAHVDDPWTSGSNEPFQRLTARQRALRGKRLALFQHEYRVLEQLAHPRIIEVYDYGVDELGPYYSMELLRGTTAQALTALPFREVCAVMRDIASALTVVHARQLLHRDVSPGNVHVDASGVAKLIDFGALTKMGVPSMMVGTPAFMAPEALALETLDARSDLYSLGALGYWLLSGRTLQAGPANGLRTASSEVTLPVPVPLAFERLLLQLLSRDRAARPSSAPEVLERLAGILGSDTARADIDAGAYLTSPELVGRARALTAIRRRALRTLRRRGDVLLSHGESGSGRTGLLDAGCSEAKLAGLLVLRIDGAACEARPLAALRALLRTLHEQLGESDRALHRVPAELSDALGLALDGTPLHALDSKSVSRASTKSPARPEELCAALAAFLRGVAEHRPIAIAVDDLDSIDSASLPLFAELATSARERPLLLLAALRDDALGRETFASLATAARLLPMLPLSADETNALVRALLGDVPNLVPVARLLHERSRGNVRSIVETVRHLVERGIVRHENAGFVLPETLGAHDLPESHVAALRARVERLGEEAKRLLGVLILLEGAALPMPAVAALARVAEPARAAAELLGAGLATREHDALHVRHAELQLALPTIFAREQERALRSELGARIGSHPAQRLRGALQYFGAERPADALPLVLAAIRDKSDEASGLSGAARLFERCVEFAVASGASRRDLFCLRRALTDGVLRYFDVCDREQLLALHETLCELAGFTDWKALAGESDPRQRLTRALQRARERHERAPEGDRMLPPEAAIRELLQITFMLVGYANSSLDLELLARLPSLTPFAAISPLFAVVEQLRLALLDGRAGRYDSYLERMHAMIDRLAQPDGAGLPDGERERIRTNLLYPVALAHAAWGYPGAEDDAAALERVPDQRVNAWRIREIAHLYAGDAAESERCRREAERLKMALGTRIFHPSGMVDTRFWAYSICDDLLMLRALLPEAERMGARFPGFRPAVLAVNAEIERLRGRPEQAIALARQAMDALPVAHNVFWPHAAGRVVRTLLELGRVEEARVLARECIALCEANGIEQRRMLLEQGLAECDAVCGDVAAGVARMERLLSGSYLKGGLLLGAMYETRARIAILERNRAEFEQAYERARKELRYGAHAATTARLDRLRERAETSGLIARSSHGALQVGEGTRIEGADVQQRAERALALLVAESGSEGGQLFVLCGPELRALARAGCSADAEKLAALLRGRVLAANEIEAERTVLLLEPAEESDPRLEVDGEIYQAVTLFAGREGYAELVGIAALRVDGASAALPYELLAAAAEAIAASR